MEFSVGESKRVARVLVEMREGTVPLSDVEAKHNEDMLADPVKTFTTDDGKEMKIYRTKDDGYRIKVNGKESKSSFGKLDDAVMACETFVQKSKR